MQRRSRVVYTDAQIKGLKVVGKILENVREVAGYSLREWSKHLEQLTGEHFTHTDIRRYERAGHKVDKRASVPTSVSPTYLKVISSFTPYDEAFLKEVVDGKYTDVDIMPTPLPDLIEQHKQKLGEFKFEQERRSREISDEVLDRTRTGLIQKDDQLKLSAFLEISVSPIREGAIAQIDKVITEQSSTETSSESEA